MECDVINHKNHSQLQTLQIKWYMVSWLLVKPWSFEVPGFDGGHHEVTVGAEWVIVEGLAGLAPASVKALIQKEGELTVVDADADRPDWAEDEEVVLAGPLPHPEVAFARPGEDECLAASERLVANPVSDVKTKIMVMKRQLDKRHFAQRQIS